MERAADIRGRKARIESLEGQLKAALAQAAALAASPADVKSSVWSTNMSDDEVRSVLCEVPVSLSI